MDHSSWSPHVSPAIPITGVKTIPDASSQSKPSREVPSCLFDHLLRAACIKYFFAQVRGPVLLRQQPDDVGVLFTDHPSWSSDCIQKTC